MGIFDHIETVKKEINGTTVYCRLNFNAYDKKQFLKDMEMFHFVNSDESRSKIVPEKFKERLKAAKQYNEMFFRKDIYNALKKGARPKIDYDDFKRLCVKLVSQYVFYLIQTSMKAMIEGQEKFWMRLLIINDFEEGSYAYWDRSQPGAVYIGLSGQLLIGRIYGPWIYTSKIDASHIDRTLIHEMEHHLQETRDTFKKEYAMQEYITRFMKLNKNRWLGCMSSLYTIFCNLFSEGLASFRQMSNADKFIFDLERIEKAKSAMEKIAKEPNKKKAEEIWFTELTPFFIRTGEYYMGAAMCYTVGLSLMMRKRKDKFISILSPEKKTLNIKDLDVYIARKKTVSIEPLDPDTYKETYKFLAAITYYTDFMKVYEDACKELGFKEPAKFIDPKFLERLTKVATNHYDRYCSKIDKEAEDAISKKKGKRLPF